MSRTHPPGPRLRLNSSRSRRGMVCAASGRLRAGGVAANTGARLEKGPTAALPVTRMLLLGAAVIAAAPAPGSRGDQPRCTPNPTCGVASPTDPEPGCKKCVSPSSWDCAACCPSYAMANSTGPSGTVSYCTKSIPGGERPTLVERFAATRTDDCGGRFPGCPAPAADPAGAVFTIFEALDIPAQVDRLYYNRWILY